MFGFKNRSGPAARADAAGPDVHTLEERDGHIMASRRGSRKAPEKDHKRCVIYARYAVDEAETTCVRRAFATAAPLVLGMITHA